MSKKAWAYVAGGAGEGRTMRHNREAFEGWRIVPRMLHGVTQRGVSTSVLGTSLSPPLLLAPIGAASLVAGNSDVIIARGAAAAKTPYVISSQGCNPMEETAAAMGSTPFWYQLYWSTDEALVDSMIKRAENCGAQALVVTLDTTILGWRPRDLNLGSLHPDDARRAIELGIDAMIVSNHGGRQVDNAIASLDALINIREAVGREPTILLDSGIRSGTDVLVALALGADACLIGRPYVYGLAISGADGVSQVIENIVAELDLTLGLLGLSSIAALSPELLSRLSEEPLEAVIKEVRMEKTRSGRGIHRRNVKSCRSISTG